MKKRCFAALLTAAVLLTCRTPALAAPEVAAPSALLMEASTGQILLEKNAHERLAPASVTKVMTLLLVMEALESGRIGWQDSVVASSAAAAKGGSQIYLEEGEQMGMEDMLKSVVIASANDCATALAEHVAGSESAFVELMNRRAQELGMTDTHFVNCTGLDDGPDAASHLSSAHDIALMSRELLKHEAIRKYTTVWMDTVRGGAFGLTNTNKLVRFYDGATGLKTGFTSGAGYCLSASAKRDGMELIAVVMHCDTSVNRFESAKALLSYGFAGWCLVRPEPEAPLSPIPVTMGTAEAVTPQAEACPPLLLDKALQKAVVCRTELLPEVEAPVEKGQQIGTLSVEANGDLLATIPLVAAESVPRLTLSQIFARLLRGLCMTAEK